LFGQIALASLASMKTAARGDSVTILDRGRPVAQILPVSIVDDSLRRLAAQGLARPARRRLAAGFWKRPLPRSGRSVVDALLEEREDRAI
jgi:antitoxin (DNA-binding transcriptional repressor) of toxin-antitoxin stability system